MLEVQAEELNTLLWQILHPLILLQVPISLNLIMMASRNNTASAAPNNKVKYSRLADSDEGYIDLQFKKTPPKVPYKAIVLATFLFLVGSVLIVVGSLLLAGYINVMNPDRTIPVLIIGILIFLPGFYHLRIAYYASKGYRGYSYEDIPDFDN
uniref:Transmembrane protein 230 n=2 Tax=Cyprinus carpio TaxID=7962 RepID=A0A9J7Y5S5_CYPCA